MHRHELALLRLTEYLARTSGRNTPERRQILQAAEDAGAPFTVDDLAEAVALTGMHVSKATVYNTVEILVLAGILFEFHVGGKALYEFMPLPGQHHLVCTTCGKIKTVRDQSMANFLRTRRYSAFTPAVYQTTVYGTCSACARKAKKTNQQPNKAK